MFRSSRSLTALAILAIAASGCQAGRSTPTGAQKPGINNSNIIAGGGGNVISAGGGNVISAGGGNVVSNKGAGAAAVPASSANGVISAGGGNVISAGGGNLLPDSVGTTLPGMLASTSAGYRVSQASLSMSTMLQSNLAGYMGSVKMVDAILSQLRKAPLAKDTPYGFDALDVGHATLLIHGASDHVTISIGKGDSATGANQLIGIEYYAAEKRGRAVFRPTGAVGGVRALVTNFDALKQQGSADGLVDTRDSATDPQYARIHWDLDGTHTAGRTFRLQIAVAANKPDTPEASGNYFYTANCLEGSGAAAAFALKTAATGDRLIWYPNDGNFLAFPISRDFYIDAQGRDLAPAQAPSELKALVPDEADLYSPAPDVPGDDALTDPTFAFPQ